MLSVDPVQSLSSGSLGVFSMAGIIIGSLLGVLILVGGGWNLLKLRRQVRCQGLLCHNNEGSASAEEGRGRGEREQ